jgi:hypothetical protein
MGLAGQQIDVAHRRLFAAADRRHPSGSVGCARACNHELNRLLPMAAPAANLQQNLPSWLKY